MFVNSGQNRVVLIVHPGTLGDVLLALPAIRALRRTFPFHECVLLAQSDIANLLQACDEVDQFWSIEGSVLTELLSRSPHLHPEVLDVLGRCSHAVGWLNDHEGRVTSNMRKFGVQHIRMLSPQDHVLQMVHMADRYCETLSPWCVELNAPWAPLVHRAQCTKTFSLFHQLTWNDEKSEQVLLIHPGSGSQHKCLSSERLGRIVQKLLNVRRRKLVICQGPADETMVIAFRQALGQIPHDVIKGLNLTEMAWLVSQGDIFLGHDSGLTHLAAALGIPTVALWGPTDPECWKPLGARVEVIRGPTCQCQDWDEVQICSRKVCLTHSLEQIVEVVECLLMGSNIDFVSQGS